MLDLDFLTDLAQRALLQSFPAPWANKITEPWRGLPFGGPLHSTRPRRPRSLTTPSDASPDSLWQKLQVFSVGDSGQRMCDQSRSDFLSKLPLDIRMIIYDMVLGGMLFHLSAQNHSSRILLDICRSPHLIAQQPHECHELSAQRPSSAPREDYDHATGLLPLLVTCRRVYSEAIQTLYRANIFEFRSSFTAFRFLRLMIPAQRLLDIRQFRLHMRMPHHPNINSRSRRDWTEMFQFFTNDMTGLRSLYLRLQTMQPMEAIIRETDDTDAADWIRPIVLMAVGARQARGCKVELVTEGVSHMPAEIFEDTAVRNAAAGTERVLELACVTLHQRIRLSFESQT